jgi:hypothetical protein
MFPACRHLPSIINHRLKVSLKTTAGDRQEPDASHLSSALCIRRIADRSRQRRSGVASQRRDIGYEATQTSTVSCDEFVECVDVAAGTDGAQGPRDRLRQTDLGKEGDTAACVAGNE